MLIGKNGFAIDLLRKCMLCTLKVFPPDNFYQGLQLVSFLGNKEEVVKAHEILLLRILCLIPSSGWVYRDSHRMKYLCDKTDPHFIFGSSEAFTSTLEAGWSLLSQPDCPVVIETPQMLPKVSLDDSGAGATFVIPNSRIGCLIGPRGSIVTYIRSTSLADVNIGRENERGSIRVITLRGSLEQVCTALSLISERLKQNYL